MELKQLSYFIEIARQGSFSRASEILEITQPSLSVQIKKLEDEIGTLLFHRLGRGVRTTEAGQVLINHSQSVLTAITDAKEEINELLNIEGGRLRVGSVQSVNAYLLPPIAAEFHRKYPKVRLQIVEHSTPRLENMLREGELDLAFSFAPPSLDEIYADALFEENIILATSKTHPLAQHKCINLEEIKDTALALFTPRLMTRKLIDAAFAQLKIKPNIVLEMNTMEGLLRSVINSDMATLVPERGAKQRDDITLIEIKNPKIFRHIGVLRRQGTYKSAASRAFEDIMRQQNSQ